MYICVLSAHECMSYLYIYIYIYKYVYVYLFIFVFIDVISIWSNEALKQNMWGHQCVCKMSYRQKKTRWSWIRWGHKPHQVGHQPWNGHEMTCSFLTKHNCLWVYPLRPKSVDIIPESLEKTSKQLLAEKIAGRWKCAKSDAGAPLARPGLLDVESLTNGLYPLYSFQNVCFWACWTCLERCDMNLLVSVKLIQLTSFPNQKHDPYFPTILREHLQETLTLYIFWISQSPGWLTGSRSQQAAKSNPQIGSNGEVVNKPMAVSVYFSSSNLTACYGKSPDFS